MPSGFFLKKRKIKKKKRYISAGFSQNKATSWSHQWHHPLGKDTYHSSDNQPGGSNTIPKRSVLISAVHSNLGSLTPSLNVVLFLFSFPLPGILSTERIVQMWTRECTHKNTTTTQHKQTTTTTTCHQSLVVCVEGMESLPVCPREWKSH